MSTKYLISILVFILSFTSLKGQKDGLYVYIEVLDLVSSGQADKANSLIDSLYQTCKNDTNSYSYACVLASKAKILSDKREIEKALNHLKRSIEIVEKNNLDKRGLAIFNADMGFLLRSIGNFDGLDYYLKANQIFREMKNWGDLAQSYNTIYPYFKNEIDASGCIYFSEVAMYYFHKANPIIDSTDAKTLIFKSSFELAIGGAYRLVDRDSAVKYYHKSLETIKKTNHPYAIEFRYHANLGIGIMDLYQEKYKESLKYLEYAQKEFLKMYSIESPRFVTLQHIKGKVYQELKQYDSAYYYMSSAIENYKKIGNNNEWISNSLCILADNEFDHGNYQKALEYAHEAMFTNSSYGFIPNDLKEVLPIDSSYLSLDNYRQSLLLKANSYYALYKETSDIELLKRTYELRKYFLEFILDGFYKNTISLDRMSENFDQNVTEGINLYLATAYELFNKTNDTKTLEETYLLVSNLKAGLMHEQNKKGYATANSQLVNLSQELVEQKKRNSDFEFIRMHEKINTDSLEKIHDLLAKSYIKSLQLRYKIKELEKQLEIKDSSNVLNFNQLTSSFEPNRLILDYYYNDSTLFIFAISAKEIHLISQPLPVDFIRKIALESRYIKAGDPALENNSKELYQILLQPISSYLQSENQITIIPYQDLFTIPFEVLMDENGYYLIENHAISYNFSSRNLHFNSENQRNHSFIGYAPNFHNEEPSDFAMRNILFTDTNFRNATVFDMDHNRISALPYAARETESIHKLFIDNNFEAVFKTNTEATESHFKANYDKYSIIHIASHGYASEQFPELSGVFFANENGEEDGYLFLSELQNLELKADLLVISACQSGKGTVSGIEGAISLPRGFMIAGAQNVAASLWKVHDERTKDFMILFYSNLLNKNLNYNEALRRAKLDCIKAGFLPMDWSGFVIYGNN